MATADINSGLINFIVSDRISSFFWECKRNIFFLFKISLKYEYYI